MIKKLFKKGAFLRAAIFIDGGYILAQLKQNKVEADYRQLVDYLLLPLRQSAPVDLLRCYFYYCPPYLSQEPTEDELRRLASHDKFVSGMEKLPRWAVRLGKLEKRHDGDREYFEQKRVDVLLSCDMVRHTAAGDVQHVVLVAGDSDFIPAVEAAKDSGATVTLWCGPINTVHKDLTNVVDEYYQIDWNEFPSMGRKIELSPKFQGRGKDGKKSSRKQDDRRRQGNRSGERSPRQQSADAGGRRRRS